jgi:hypothetical protein
LFHIPTSVSLLFLVKLVEFVKWTVISSCILRVETLRQRERKGCSIKHFNSFGSYKPLTHYISMLTHQILQTTTVKYIRKYTDGKILSVYTERNTKDIIVGFKKDKSYGDVIFYRRSYWRNNSIGYAIDNI